MPEETPSRPSGKQAINIRLSAEARRILDKHAEEKGISRTAVIELAVRFYDQHANGPR